MLERYGGSESILVAEDEPIVLALTITILKIHGYEVFSAIDGAEALELHKAKPRVDLVLTDVIMPGLSGPALVHELKKDVQGLRCVFMSGYNPEQIKDRGIGDVSCNYLHKPFTPESLLKKVREALDSTLPAI